MLKVLVMGLSLFMVACATTPPPQFYVLDALSQITETTVVSATKQQIGLGPITLPVLLERKQIVTRSGDGLVNIAEFQQWAEPLKDNIVRVLCQNLRQRQPNSLIRAYPWSAYGIVDYRIMIDITRLDAELGQWANLEINWSIMSENKHTIIKNAHTSFRRKLDEPSYQAVVLALSHMLSDFSGGLAQAIAELPNLP